MQRNIVDMFSRNCSPSLRPPSPRGVRSQLISTLVDPDWRLALSKEFDQDYFVRLCDFLEERISVSTVFPPLKDVFNALNLCPLPQTKVVILGQDPYHGVGQAHGLSFSMLPGCRPQPSLLNIFKELQQDIQGIRPPAHGNLTNWSKQGVLLLNATLTVEKGRPNSHQGKGWEHFTDACIRAVSDRCTGVVFLLWGNYAQKKASIVNLNKHYLLKAAHPSPLSANHGFFGCRHFSKTNDILKKLQKTPIDWSVL